MVGRTFGVSALLLLVLQTMPARSGAGPEVSLREASPRFQFMSSAKEKMLRDQFPQVDDEDVQRLLDDPALILYTDEEMPRAHQDWSSGLPGIHSPHYNLSANPTEPFGNGNVEFPWGAPGGTHRSTNVSTFRFVRLPRDREGKPRPIVWYRKFLRGSSTQGYAWTYPVGTVFGEVLQMQSPTGDHYTFELRLRTREYGEWSVDVFRPFPTSVDLAERVKELRPQWRDDAMLVKLVEHLKSPLELVSHTLADTNHPHIAFRQSMGIDTLPAIEDDDLVTQLLTKTTFRSALGGTWRKGSNDVLTAAPTTEAPYHIIPTRYDAGFIEVDRFSCMRCHETVNHHVGEFEPGRDWYGRIRGSDGIFSFHPFDPSCVSYNGSGLPVEMNRKLVAAGLLEPYDQQKHPGAEYQRLLDLNE